MTGEEFAVLNLFVVRFCKYVMLFFVENRLNIKKDASEDYLFF